MPTSAHARWSSTHRTVGAGDAVYCGRPVMGFEAAVGRSTGCEHRRPPQRGAYVHGASVAGFQRTPR